MLQGYINSLDTGLHFRVKLLSRAAQQPIVRFDPPKIEQIIPPTIEAITPAIGGASEAIARPKPRGRATRETTNPEKIFFGSELKNDITPLSLFIFFHFHN